MDGKSILGILLLAAVPGQRAWSVSAEGDDEEDAVDALAALVDGRLRRGGVRPALELRGIGVSRRASRWATALIVEREAVPVFRLLCPRRPVEARGGSG